MDNPWESEDGLEAIKAMGLPQLGPGNELCRQMFGPGWQLTLAEAGIRDSNDGASCHVIPYAAAEALLNQRAIKWLRSKVAWGTIDFEKYKDYSVEISHGQDRKSFYASTLAEALIQAVLKEKEE